MKSLAVSVCITAVTGMAAVSLLVFFWCSSGVLLCSSGVLLVFFCVLLCYRTPEEHQKDTRRTPEEPRRTQKNPEGEEHQPPLGVGVGVCARAVCLLKSLYSARFSNINISWSVKSRITKIKRPPLCEVMTEFVKLHGNSPWLLPYFYRAEGDQAGTPE